MKRTWAIGVIVVIGIAVGAWWWTHRGKDAAAPAQPTAAAQKPATPPRPDRRSDEEPAQMSVLLDDDPRGNLRLEGVVFDSEDHPVAGATVVLGSTPPRTATSDPGGAFAFDALVGRPYSLVARSPHGVAGPVTARLTAKSDPVVLHLRPAAKVVVAVTAGGKPVDGATVELRGTDDQKETTKNGTATFTNVVPGGYQIAASAEATATALQWIQVGAGETRAALSLSPGAPVVGKVIDDKGAPVSGARVLFGGASNWSQQGDDRRDAVVSAADGTFRFAALPAGSFRFLASHPDYAPGSSTIVTLDGRSERSGVTVQLAAGAVIRGRVVDQAKQPVVGARVRLGIALRTMIFAPPRQTYSDGNGMFELKGMPRRELVAVAMHDTGSSQNVPVDATRGDVGNVELVIDMTGTIAGIVVDPAGQPIEGVQVSAGPNFRDSRAVGDFSQWRLRGFPQDLTDGSGKFTLTGLSVGSYTITAMRSHAVSRGRRGATEGVAAQTGDTNLKIVLQPEGGVKGKVALADGSAPAAFTVSLGMMQQAFTGGGEFEIDSLPPQTYELLVRGPSFTTRAVEVVVEPTKTTDVGTITVAKGRTLAGVVTADGRPVPNATIYAGRMVFGNGSTSSAQFGPMGQSAKTATSGDDGTFSLAGFTDGDLAIVAESDQIGRSKAIRIPTDMPGQGELVLELQKFGALSGVLRQGGKPAEGVFVSCQSTTAPNAIYSVASGPDGAYRFDKLAPDTYKVSATLGMPMMGMKFYSKQVDVPPAREVTIDLAVEAGQITLEVTAVPKTGKLGVASVWVASGLFVARTASELSLRMAAAGAGSSQWVILRQGEPAVIKELTPGVYSACVVPFPAEVHGMAAMGYVERHGDKLPAYCQRVEIAAAPPVQQTSVPVELPPFIADGSGGGSSH